MTRPELLKDEVIPFDLEPYGKVLKDSFYHGALVGKPVQSVCWDSRNRKYVVGFSHNDNPKLSTLIRMKDLTFWNSDVMLMQNGIELGHCNDLEYNPTNHRIYVARGDKYIGVVNPETLTVTELIPIDVYAWAISRYKNGDWFIHDCHCGRRYDPDFKNPRILSDGDTERLAETLGVPYDPEQKCYKGYWQGSVIIDDRPYMIYTEWKDLAWGFKSCVLVSFLQNGEMEIYRADTGYETEGVCLKDGKLQFIYGNIYIGGMRWDMSEMKFKQAYGVIKNIKLKANDNVDVDCSGFLPEGYEMTYAGVNFKNGNQWRTLPYVDGNGNVGVRILKVDKKKLVIRSTADAEKITLQITAFCRKSQ